MLNKKYFTFAAVLFSVLSFAQDAGEIKKANNLIQQAGMRLVVDKDYGAACLCYEQAFDIFRVQYGPDSRKCLEAVRGMADCYEGMGEISVAIKYYRRLLKSDDVWQIDYACLKLGRLYHQIGNIDASIDAYTTGILQFKNKDIRWNSNYYKIYVELFRLNYAVGNSLEAIRVGSELCEKIRDDKGKWIALSTELASIYDETGNHAEALRLFHEILAIYLDSDNGSETMIQTTNIAMTFHSIGGVYKNVGNYQKAIEYLTQACERYRGLGLYNDIRYCVVLVQLSVCHSALLNRSASIGYAREAYEVSAKSDFHEDEKIATLANYANILIGFKEHDDANNLLKDALEANTSNKSKSLICNSMIGIYDKLGDSGAALMSAQQAVLYDEDPVNLHNLAVLYSENKMYDEAVSPLIRGWEMAVKEMRSYFLQSRENEYKHIWNKYRQLIKAPVDLVWQTDNDEILSYAYNSLLMTKSIQLSSSINFRKAIEGGSDAGLKELYKRWMQTPEDSPEYGELELELLSKAREERFCSDVFSIRWQDVKERLSEGEIAVEFAHITRSDTGERAYLALVLTRDSDVPEDVFLSTDDGIENFGARYSFDAMCNSSEVGESVWGKVIAAARKTSGEIRTIYFVPDGILYSLPIEYMMCDGYRMNERYTMRRLTSTREILNAGKRKYSDKTAALFGGIDYSVTIEDMEYYAYMVSSDRSMNSSWGYLPGTKQEIEAIDGVLVSDGYATQIYSGPSCVEESFKQYSGCSPEIIHIATHGFYLPVEDGSADAEESALKRCGLAFAGANQSKLGGHKIPDGIEDGILSASEIAMMDLGNTGLVVMSACQTGLGDVEDDGVFGLQRAFKKAGVESLLMSLWNVDDAVTQRLMTEFYRGVADGMSKHDALANAQQCIRKASYIDREGKVRSMDDPYYWAPFVLLE